MGREIRKVPPNWDHPKTDRHGREDYQPMHDENFATVFSRWLADFDRIRMNEMTDFERECYPDGLRQWLVEDGAPPQTRRPIAPGKTKRRRGCRLGKPSAKARP